MVQPIAHADDMSLRPDQTAYLDLYKEFVETNTTVTTGSVLAGLVLEEDGLASHLLRDRGVTVAAVREVVTRLAELGVTEGRDGGGPAG